jgi:gliding motility-associated-like protein
MNREGEIVYESDSYDNSWGGTYKGKLLPDATYYYVLKFADSDKVYKGAVTILHH